MLLVSVAGCRILGKKSVILISKDLVWTIPKGETFRAIQRPAYPKITDFVADEALSILYQGKLLELEKEANDRAFKQAKVAKKQGMLIGTVGSIFAFLGGILAYFKKKKK